MDNVVTLADYRQESAVMLSDDHRTDDRLRTMFYDQVVDWAGADFDRLIAVARLRMARDYRPEWIQHQLENNQIEPTPHQAVVLARMIEAAGPYMSRRQRWILRQLREKPLHESRLVTMAAGAAEYRDLMHIDRGIAHDLAKLVDPQFDQGVRGWSSHRCGSGPSGAHAQRGAAHWLALARLGWHRMPPSSRGERAL